MLLKYFFHLGLKLNRLADNQLDQYRCLNHLMAILKLNLKMTQELFLKLRQRYSILLAALAIALCCNSSAIAVEQIVIQPNTDKAAVVLDGRELFKIGSLGQLNANERADKVSNLLQTKLQSLASGSSESLEIDIVQQNDWTVLKIGDRHLLTVGQEEVIPGMSIDEQALIWREQIQSGLNRGIIERSPQYRLQIIKLVAIVLFSAITIEIGLSWLKSRYRRKLLNETLKKRYSWAILGIFILQGSIWFVLAYYVANLFAFSRYRLYLLSNFLETNFNAEIINLGNESFISPRHLTVLLLVGVIWWLFVSWLGQLFQSKILPLTELENTLQNSIIFIIRYGLLSLGWLIILLSGGIDFRSLAIILSALGVGIGFGLQNIVKDFVSGVILTLTRPIKIGELVEVGEYKGLVVRIGARTTDISHVDRHIMTVPNSRFIEDTVKNWNRSGLNRVKVYVDVAYKSDRDLVYKVLLSAAQVYHPDILKHPPPKVKLRQFNEQSLLFRVVVFIKDPLKEPKVRNHIQLNIDRNFRKYGIEIPFPQRDIHLKVPQLDNLVANLTQKYAPSQTPLYYPRKSKINPNSTIVSTSEDLTIQEEYNWDELITQMHGETGLPIKDRRYGLKTYQQVFTGIEAVAWLMEREKATRAEAIEIGKIMVKQGIIHHVLDEHDFKDEALFYRFYIDEQNDSEDNIDWESGDN